MQTIEQYLLPSGYAAANVTSAGAVSNDVPYLVIGMPCQFVVHVVDASGQPATPAGLANVESWKFVLAGDFDPETAPCYTTDEIVWDAEECAWTVLLDETRTASMLALLDDEPWVNIGCEVVGLGEDEDWAHPAYVLQWTARIRGRRDSDGLGIHPSTGERVANVLSAQYPGAELRMTDDGNLEITVHGSSAPVVVTPAQIAAVAQNAVTPEDRAKWNDRERILSADGKTELRARNGGDATLGVLNIGLGNPVVTFPVDGSFKVWTDDIFWTPAVTQKPIEFVGPFAVPGPTATNYWVPKDSDQFVGYDPTAATSGWHLYAPNRGLSPAVMQYRDGPAFTIERWSTNEPVLRPMDGTSMLGTFTFERPTVDSTDYNSIAKVGHTHNGVKSGDTEVVAVNGGSAQIRRTTSAVKTALESARLSWTYGANIPGAGTVSGTGSVLIEIPTTSSFSIDELAAGVLGFDLHVHVYIVANTGPYDDGFFFPNWFEGDCHAALVSTQNGESLYSLECLNAKLNGATVTIDTTGVTIFRWTDTWHSTIGTLLETAARTEQTTRSDSYAVITTKQVASTDNIETDKTLSVLNKAADAKATGDAMAGKASTADATLTDTTTFSEWTISPAGKFTDVLWSNEYDGVFEWMFSFDNYPLRTGNHDPNATSVSAVDPNDGLTYTATRTVIQGYKLGLQSNKLLAPAGNYALKSEIPPAPQLRYALVSPALAASGTTVSATLQDRAVNAITLAPSVTAATFTFPAPVTGFARDFFVRLVIEGSTVPTISFLESGGGSLEDVFDADDDAWAEIEPGVNVLMFTETSQEVAS